MAPGRGAIARYGLAITAPRWALAVADDPAEPGRAGTDLLVLLLGLVVAVHLRALVGAGWLAVAVGWGIGLHGLLAVASRAFTTDLAFLLIAAIVIFAAGGPRRGVGRAFDLACVAIVPLVAVEAAANAIIHALDLATPPAVGLLVSIAGTTWSGAIVALALVQMRRAPRTIEPAPEVVPRARASGWGLAAVLAAGVAIQGAWVARNLDLLRPLTAGDAAPELSLPRVGQGGALGERVTLASLRGQVVVVDLWATWCKPCLASMPSLAALADRDRARGLEVLAVNLDDAGAARALFDDKRYPMTLVFDDSGAADRLGVTTIPHAVVIDRRGVVRGVFRSDPEGAAALAEQLLDAR
jgi:thiol-disulfide isomerase/thioredoxin